MTMQRIVHIAPALPPAVNGLGDFCSLLADSLKDEGYENQAFLIRSEAPASDRHVLVFRRANFLDALRRQQADIVILHYSGYGYDKHGLPFYIVRDLAKYRQESRCHMLIFFHELYAPRISPMKLTYYTSVLQKMIVRGLYKMADLRFTSCTPYLELIHQISGDRERCGMCTGIFSNIPDHLYNDSLDKQEASMAVFGSLHRRRSVYENPRFRLSLQRFGIRHVYDIGPGRHHFSLAAIAVTSMGALAPEEVAAVLNKCEYGALAYEPHLIGKSGIFSAYAAFGVIPINVSSYKSMLYDGLEEGRNYFSWDLKTPDQTLMEATARKAVRDWYERHSQKAVARKLAEELSKLSPRRTQAASEAWKSEMVRGLPQTDHRL